MNHRIGNYMYQSPEYLKKKGRWIIGIAAAYNAGGLIGSEHNGIFILDNTAKKVVLDKHLIIDSGYHGPSAAQKTELERLAALPPTEFLDFIQAHPRARDDYRGA